MMHAIRPLPSGVRFVHVRVRRCQAASCLASIDADVGVQKAIIQAGCLAPLVALLRSDASAAAQAFAAKALANAASYGPEEGQNAIVRLGALPLLLALLVVGKAQTPAAGTLANLAAFNASVQAEILSVGGIAPLLALLNGRNIEAAVAAAAALAEIARDNLETQAAIARAGGILPLLALLSSTSSAAQSKGMAALAQLASGNSDNQDAIARMGGIRPLINLLDASTSKWGRPCARCVPVCATVRDRV